MKSRTLFLSACFVLAVAAVAWAADVNGKWTAQVPGRGGQTAETTFNFKADAGKVTGTVTSPRGENAISDGKLDGDNLSFAVAIDAGGRAIKLLYKGKVAADEIKFTRSIEGMDQPPAEFTAKRVK